MKKVMYSILPLVSCFFFVTDDIKFTRKERFNFQLSELRWYTNNLDVQPRPFREKKIGVYITPRCVFVELTTKAMSP